MIFILEIKGKGYFEGWKGGEYLALFTKELHEAHIFIKKEIAEEVIKKIKFKSHGFANDSDFSIREISISFASEKHSGSCIKCHGLVYKKNKVCGACVDEIRENPPETSSDSFLIRPEDTRDEAYNKLKSMFGE